MRKKYAFYILNIGIPLVLGLGIYLFCYKTTYINTTFTYIFGFALPYFYSDNAFHFFFTCWACDILWAYALTFSLHFCFKVFKRPLIITGISSTVFATIIELLQIKGFINGTFDILDIVLEIVAILLAIIIIKIIETSKKDDSK